MKGKGGCQKASSNDLTKAATVLKCPPAKVQVFSNQTDPLNPSNVVSGGTSDWGHFTFCSLNNRPIQTPELIFPTPKISPLPDTLPAGDFKQVYLSNKWNGTNIMVYKYHDNEGQTYISAGTRGYAFLKDTRASSTLSTVVALLGLEQPTTSESVISLAFLPTILTPLASAHVQSITFELCGDESPELVKYSFSHALIPLYYTMYSGNIKPYLNPYEVPHTPLGVNEEFWKKVRASYANVGPIDFKQDEFKALIEKTSKDMLELNTEFRTLHGKKGGYFFQNFACEGKVIYLLDEKGEAKRNCIFKLKPSDFSHDLHWVSFNGSIQTYVLEGLKKVYERSPEFSESALKSELDVTDKMWSRLGPEIMKFVFGIPNVFSPKYTASTSRLLIMVGTPGSGKSTIANKLVQLSSNAWGRVNQDEMGNRRACEVRARDFLNRGRSTIVDRCNFDFAQRNVWVKLAAECKCNSIVCIYLKIPAEVCKDRLKTRKGHPTIKDAEAGAGIIDRFANDLIPPIAEEGFSKVITVTSDEEVEEAIKYLVDLVKQ